MQKEESEMDKSTKSSVSCYFCAKLFSQRKELEGHLRGHTKERPFKWSNCSKSFPRPCRRHEKTEYLNNGQPPTDKTPDLQKEGLHVLRKPKVVHSCGVCSKSFRGKGALETHIRVHIGKTFKCRICLKLFIDEDQCTQHEKIHPEYLQNQGLNILPDLHSCDICSKSFKGKRYLKVHIRIHAGEKPYRCGFCLKSFIDKYKCRQHEKLHLPNQDLTLLQRPKPHSCDVCSKSFRDKCALKRHLLIHTEEEPFKCGICGRLFTDWANCTQHEKSHPTVKPKKPTLSCYFCGKLNRKTDDLYKHLRVHTRERPFRCEICLNWFSHLSGLRRHNKSHLQYILRTSSHRKSATYSCYFCTKTVSCRSNLAKHLRVHTRERPLQCEICLKWFRNLSGLQRHNKSHLQYILQNPSNPKPTSYSCYFCAKTISCRSNLGKHLRVHTRESPFQCEVCLKWLKDPSGYRRHKATHPEYILYHAQNPSHQKIATYFCYFCYKVVHDKSKLQVHLRMHTGEKPFNCEFCLRSFTQLSDCLNHEKIHPEYLQKQGLLFFPELHSCNICYKSFKAKKNLWSHMRIHTGKKPYRCGFCLKSFFDQYKCTRHEKIHLPKQDVNPLLKPTTHSCGLCSKSCRDKYDLKMHVLSHTGEKLFTCEICFKGFSSPSSCLRHKKSHPEFVTLRPLNPSHQKLKTCSCYFCAKLFLNKTNLERHIRIHTGEKPFQCGICLSSSANPTIYSRHAKLHKIKPSESCLLLERTF